MEAIKQLEREGYQVQLTGENIKCRKMENVNPDPHKVYELLEEIKKHKAEAIEYLRRFEYDAHIREKRCPAGVCEELI